MASSEESLEHLKEKPKQEFNRHRKIVLRNIPPSTEGEITEFLGPYKATKIEISESLDTATITLDDGRFLEEIVKELSDTKLKDNVVTVSFCSNDRLLCVAHMPPRYSDEEFLKFVSQHGPVKYCFLIRSETTGHSKSYGLVEFEEQDLEKIRKIRDELDWKEVGSQVLHVDFVESSFQSWERLHSRCLFLSGLPKSFTEVSKLREMFSVVTSPVYCQIMMKEKESLGFGIVEFRKPDDAEETWERLRGQKIEDTEMTITFCIPSKSAVVINNRIMWKYCDKLQQKSSLLPDPVATKPVIANNPVVLSLVKQNPYLMEDFTKVLMEMQQAYVQHMMSPANKPGLLGPAPSLPMSPMMNPHLQLGLIVMMALHIHSEKKNPFTGALAKQLNTLSDTGSSQQADSSKKPSILGDPLTAQANILLTNLKQQLNQVPIPAAEVKEDDDAEKSESESASSDPLVQGIIKKFMRNAQYLNLSLLVNMGQVITGMQATSGDVSPVAAAAAAAAASVARHAALVNPPGSGKGLLGDPPRPQPNPAAVRFLQTMEAVASQNFGGQNQGFLSALMTNINASHSTMGTIEKKTSLLGEPPARQQQSLSHQQQQKQQGGGGGFGMGMSRGAGMGGSMGPMGGTGSNEGSMGSSFGQQQGFGGKSWGSGSTSSSGNFGGMGRGLLGSGAKAGGIGGSGGGSGRSGSFGGSGGGSGIGGGFGGSTGGGFGGSGGEGFGISSNDSFGNNAGGFGSTAGGFGNTAGGFGSKGASDYSFGGYDSGYGGNYSGGYGDGTYGDQSGYQYSDYGGDYSGTQDSYNYQASNSYSGNFGDYTGGYSSGTANNGFGFSQSQSGNFQEGGGYGRGNFGTQGGSNTYSSPSMGSAARSMTMSKNFSGGGVGAGGGTGVGAGAAFGSGATQQSSFGTGMDSTTTTSNSSSSLLDTPRNFRTSGALVGTVAAGSGAVTSTGTGTGVGFGQGVGSTQIRSGMSTTGSYQGSGVQDFIGNDAGSYRTMGMGSGGYADAGGMDGYTSTNYMGDSAAVGGNYGGYGVSSSGFGTYGSTTASYTTGATDFSSTVGSGNGTGGLMPTPGSTPLMTAGSKRGYSHLLPKPEPSPEGDYIGQHSQGLGGHYEKRPRLF
ncbi:spidroin-1-like isoform X2 [Pomacea canaliculata]|uniref:spidroin-1-like isoform X2 n=1 Tax=Pomacea canaliculata TaxID=400727 RepID=UPI000D731102|nr:spidroin-1-like isoform X2 [Pomacea canaliculata]